MFASTSRAAQQLETTDETNGASPWQLVFTKGAVQRMRRIPEAIRNRVEAGMAKVAEDPAAPNSNLAPLTAARVRRLRVGKWRVLFELEHESRTVRVLDVLPRGSAYKK